MSGGNSSFVTASRSVAVVCVSQIVEPDFIYVIFYIIVEITTKYWDMWTLFFFPSKFKQNDWLFVFYGFRYVILDFIKKFFVLFSESND